MVWEDGGSNPASYPMMGYFLPRATPEPIVAKLNAALDTPSVAARLRDVGTTVVAPERRSPAYLRSFVETEIGKWTETIKSSGVKLN